MSMLKINHIEEHSGGKLAFVHFDGQEARIKVLTSKTWYKDLVPGYEADFKFETKLGKPKDPNNPDGDKWPDDKFIKAVNGEEGNPPRVGNAGGGGSRLTPEQFLLEKRSILASVCLKEAREMNTAVDPVGTADEVLAIADRFYQWTTKKVGL